MAVVAVGVGWIGLSALVGLFAHNRGREAALAVIASLILSPVFGFLLVVALKDKVAERRHAEILAAIRGAAVHAGDVLVPDAEKVAAPSRSGIAEDRVAIAIVLILIVVVVIVGVTQLGSSANTTFDAVSSAM